MATAKEFIAFWMENSVHPDESHRARRGRDAVQQLADNLIRAAASEGFTEKQVDAEIGNPYDYIRADIDRQNDVEHQRLGKEAK